MPVLRGAGIPCRFQGFTIDKTLQKGAITGVAYVLAPRSIIHSWIEVWFGGRWVELEGFILDMNYLSKLQERFADREGAFCGFGAAKPDLRNPGVEWTGWNTTSRMTTSTTTSGSSTIGTPFTPSTAPTCRASRVAVPGRGLPLEEPQRRADPWLGRRAAAISKAEAAWSQPGH